MWLPSLSVNSRTQPTWSGASPRSMAEGPTAGCQAEWLLKSRSTAHTRSIGASITADRRTRISDVGGPDMAPQPPTFGTPGPAVARLWDRHRTSTYLATTFFSESKAAWNTPWPICSARACSRSGAQSNSAHHSANVRLPSVTGVSLRVAT